MTTNVLFTILALVWILNESRAFYLRMFPRNVRRNHLRRVLRRAAIRSYYATFHST